MERDGTDHLAGVRKRRREVRLHVSQLAEALVSAGVEPAKFVRRLYRNHLTFPQRVDDRNFGLEGERAELRLQLGTNAARSQQTDAATLDRNEHAACGLDDGETFGQEDASNIFDRARFGKSRGDVEQVARPIAYALQLLTKFLQFAA